MSTLLHELIFRSAERAPATHALSYQGGALSYEALVQRVSAAAATFLEHGARRSDRIAGDALPDR